MGSWSLTSKLYRFRQAWFMKWILEEEKDNMRYLLEGVQAGLILDIGSGIGSSLDLFPENRRLVCCDRAVPMLKKIKGRVNLHTSAADAEHLPFRDGIFDMVSLIGVIEYLKDLDLVFQETARVLQPGGFLLLTSSPPSLWTFFRLALGKRLHPRDGAFVNRFAHDRGFFILGRTCSFLQEQFLFQYDP